MNERPITIRQKPLLAILQAPDGLIRLRRPQDGLYKNVAEGDFLWLRERFYLPKRVNHLSPTNAEAPDISPAFAVDLVGQDLAALGLGISRAAHTLPRFWSRFHFTVHSVTRQNLLEITLAEAQAEGFSSREAWIRDWDNMVSSVSGRMRTRMSEYDPEVLVFVLQLHRSPLDLAAEAELNETAAIDQEKASA